MKKFFVALLVLFFMSATSCYAQTVVFNTKTKKYHSPSCSAAIKCTKSCVKIDKKSAKARGGVACKICGG